MFSQRFPRGFVASTQIIVVLVSLSSDAEGFFPLKPVAVPEVSRSGYPIAGGDGATLVQLDMGLTGATSGLVSDRVAAPH